MSAMADPRTPMPGRFHVAATAESHFSWLRTRMSLERTLMSWVRTATALIGFGFTIVQFYEQVLAGSAGAHLRFQEAPRYFGLALLVAGVLALAISMRQYRQMLRYLWSADFAPVAGIATEPATTPLLGVAMVLLLIGLFACASVIVNLF